MKKIQIYHFSNKHDARDIMNDLANLGEKLSWERAPRDLSCRIDEFVYGIEIDE